MRILLACCVVWAFVALCLFGIQYAQASDDDYMANESFTTKNELTVDRFYDKSAGVVCYVPVSIEPNISCVRVR